MQMKWLAIRRRLLCWLEAVIRLRPVLRDGLLPQKAEMEREDRHLRPLCWPIASVDLLRECHQSYLLAKMGVDREDARLLDSPPPLKLRRSGMMLRRHSVGDGGRMLLMRMKECLFRP